MTAPFLSGRELSARFHAEVVQPILRDALGDEPYSAALIGYGSEVQGFDDRRSTDHAWGPRMTVFLAADAYDRLAVALDESLGQELPGHFCGYPVRFAVPDGAPLRHTSRSPNRPRSSPGNSAPTRATDSRPRPG